jgi:hypothetical protein
LDVNSRVSIVSSPLHGAGDKVVKNAVLVLPSLKASSMIIDNFAFVITSFPRPF